MKTGTSKYNWLALISLASALIYLLANSIWEAGFNDGDSISHYLIARWSWKYPELLLDHWGKPFFTLVSSPFAQFGPRGIQIFNLLCASASAWLCFLTARRLHLRFRWLSILFLFFIPVYFINILTGLTEILFGLVLIASVYLMLVRRTVLAAILISFLPFCRTEGFLILPLFMIALIYLGRFRHIPLLFTGLVLYSLAGWGYYNDLLWVFHQNPYHEVDQYDQGRLSYYFEHTERLGGIPLSISFLIGLLYLPYSILVRNAARGRLRFDARILEMLLVFGTGSIYFLAHVYFWYRGTYGSFGMHRVMAAIGPVLALGALRGLMVLCSATNLRVQFQWFPAFIFAFWVLYQPKKVFELPLYPDERHLYVKNACQWVKEQKLTDRYIYFTHPYVAMQLDLDKNDSTRSKELIFVRKRNLSANLLPGSIIIWDSHLGPNNSGVHWDSLAQTQYYQELKRFEAPKDSWMGDFRVVVLKRKE